jgi:hypothetical protein
VAVDDLAKKVENLKSYLLRPKTSMPIVGTKGTLVEKDGLSGM